MKPKSSLCALIVAALLVSVFANAATAAQPPVAPGSTFYRVQPGDNLYRISLRFGVSMYAIIQANGLANANYVYVGQILRIPTGPVAPPSPPPMPRPPVNRPPVTTPPSDGVYYTVQYGDTLAIIAARFGTTVYAILQANGISNPNFVYVGQVLWIPGHQLPPQPSGGNWRGEYFNNVDLAGPPSAIRYDQAINFDWGLGGPHPRIAADCFSVRWTRSLRLAAGTWRFTTATDDGVRLWVDDALVIDQWQEQPETVNTADVPLGAGNHQVRMEYYEQSGLAVARLRWDNVSDGGPGDCRTCRGWPSPTGAWLGQYYDNMFLSGDPQLTRTDGAIDFNWGSQSPGGDIPRWLWSARWTQTAWFDKGKYRFHAMVDDGVRVYVDGTVVIDEWEDNPGTEFMADKVMNPGNHALKVEFYQKGYDAKIKVWWERLP